MTDAPDLPLFTAARARERRAGIKPLPSPPVQTRPAKPRVKRRKRTPEPVHVATVSAIPIWKNGPRMEALADALLDMEPGNHRLEWLEGVMQRQAKKREALGLSPGWIAMERAGIRRAIEIIVEQRCGTEGHGPEVHNDG